ncbi:MAG: hypothetical protein ACFFDN_47595 [Candidatus Hodarchaeota archaeon]
MMIEVKSFEGEISQFIQQTSIDFIIFDLETRDSSRLNIWDSEIISFAFCFTQIEYNENKLIPHFHLMGEIIENLSEEKTLVQNILAIFSSLNKVQISGHNFQLNLPCKATWRNPHGYDFKKILDRGLRYQLSANFLSSLNCYDTMNVAYYNYDHDVVPRFQKDGRRKKMLRTEELELDFGIIRPKEIPKLGVNVREIFDERHNRGRFSLILKYNLIDTIVEAIITLIFKDQMQNYGRISKLLPNNVFSTPFHINKLPEFEFIQKISN